MIEHQLHPDGSHRVKGEFPTCARFSEADCPVCRADRAEAALKATQRALVDVEIYVPMEVWRLFPKWMTNAIAAAQAAAKEEEK